MTTDANAQTEGRVKIKTGYPRYRAFHKSLGSIVGFGDNNKIHVRPDLSPSEVLILYPHEVDPRPGTVLPAAITQTQLA